MADKKPAENYTPRQVAFAMHYYIPTSDTYGNAYASAKAAGYAESQAIKITAQNLQWIEKIYAEIFGEATDKKNLVSKAKKVLSESLDGRDKRLAQDTAKFIAKTTPEFSDKMDVTSNGEAIQVPIIRIIDDRKKA